jgi:hypothetical protein
MLQCVVSTMQAKFCSSDDKMSYEYYKITQEGRGNRGVQKTI